MGENHCLEQYVSSQKLWWGRDITLTLPIRLAMLAAQSVETAEIMLVTKNIEPSCPEGSENFCLKKNVIHDLWDGIVSAMGW